MDLNFFFKIQILNPLKDNACVAYFSCSRDGGLCAASSDLHDCER